MVKVIPRTKPLEARRIIEVFSSGPKLEILRLLLTKGPLSASEIARELKVKISTVMEHLDKLLECGLVTYDYVIERGRVIRKFKIAHSRIILEIDLARYLNVPSEEYLMRQALRYLNLKYAQSSIPLKPSVKDVAETLNIDINEAIPVTEYLISNEELTLNYVVNKIISMLNIKQRVALEELRKSIKAHRYWIIRAIKVLEEKGECILENNIVRRVVSLEEHEKKD